MLFVLKKMQLTTLRTPPHHVHCSIMYIAFFFCFVNTILYTFMYNDAHCFCWRNAYVMSASHTHTLRRAGVDMVPIKHANKTENCLHITRSPRKHNTPNERVPNLLLPRPFFHSSYTHPTHKVTRVRLFTHTHTKLECYCWAAGLMPLYARFTCIAKFKWRYKTEHRT